MALTGFNVMLEAEDAVGACFVTYGVIAGDEAEAGRLAEGAAQAEGFWSVEIDEIWRPDDAEEVEPGDIPEVLGRNDPIYLDEEMEEDEEE
jgi:hypothetical protein